MKKLLFVAAVAAVGASAADVIDRPAGIKIGQRLTLKPAVNLSVSYDNNVGGSHEGKHEDIMWSISPMLGIDYRAEHWALLINAFYSYYAYTKSDIADRHNQHTYGETLRWNWSDIDAEGKGWSLMLSETYRKITMADDMTMEDGRGYSPDRQQLTLNGGIQRRINERWHAGLTGGYYMLDYDNDTSGVYQSYYGWQRWQGGLEAGYAVSKWADILVAGMYQGYHQENTENTIYGSDSQGYTAQFGFGSHMTERISYRLLGGWSRFEYSGGDDESDGFVYSASGSWKISETWSTMFLATSYYQPSEREQAAKTRVDALSWGLAKSMIRGKLRATFDFAYRHEEHEHVGQTSRIDYGLDVFTGRLGLHYTINRFLGIFANLEYQRSWNDESDYYDGVADYDRFRGTLGARITY